MELKARYRFLLNNLWKGVLWFTVLVGLFLVVKEFFGPTEIWMEPLHDKPITIYSIFLFSEVVFGIIPPEVFMIWSIHGGAFDSYVLNVVLLSIVSYGAGIFGFFIGSKMRSYSIFIRIKETYLDKYQKNLKRFGGILVVTAALTPLPFSAVAMAVAAFRFPFKYYVFYSLSRFVRYAVYGYIVWHANAL